MLSYSTLHRRQIRRRRVGHHVVGGRKGQCRSALVVQGSSYHSLITTCPVNNEIVLLLIRCALADISLSGLRGWRRAHFARHLSRRHRDGRAADKTRGESRHYRLQGQFLLTHRRQEARSRLQQRYGAVVAKTGRRSLR